MGVESAHPPSATAACWQGRLAAAHAPSSALVAICLKAAIIMVADYMQRLGANRDPLLCNGVMLTKAGRERRETATEEAQSCMKYCVYLVL
jgi:hypothetical protein